MAQVIQSIFREIKDIVYPINCVICYKHVKENQNCICEYCFSEFEPAWLEDWIDKIRFSKGIDEVYSYWYTISTINDIIPNIIYHNQPKLGEELGRRMALEIPIDELKKIGLIIAAVPNLDVNKDNSYC